MSPVPKHVRIVAFVLMLIGLCMIMGALVTKNVGAQ